MNKWQEHELTAKLVQVLAGLQAGSPHHFGQPYVSTYQLAIALEQKFPDLVAAIGKPIGGAHTGQETSLAQYISNELSKRIKVDRAAYPIEGALIADKYVKSMTFKDGGGGVIESSLAGSGFPLTLFRLRQT